MANSFHCIILCICLLHHHHMACERYSAFEITAAQILGAISKNWVNVKFVATTMASSSTGPEG